MAQMAPIGEPDHNANSIIREIGEGSPAKRVEVLRKAIGSDSLDHRELLRRLATDSARPVETAGSDDHVHWSAAALLRRFDRLRLPPREARSLAGALLERAGVLTELADWTNVLDRDELAARLEVLHATAAWDESLAPFVTFFFRASVADLYQPAALAMGRHLHHSAALREYFQRFADDRGVALDQPVQLNGTRPARRILLALTAASGTDIPELQLTREPIARQGEQAVIPENAADLSIVLLALQVQREVRPDEMEMDAVCQSTLEQITQLPLERVSRATVQRFGELLPACRDAAASIWQKQYEREVAAMRSLPAGRFGRRVAGLCRIDDLLRYLAAWSHDRAEPLVRDMAERSAHDPAAHFALARWSLWHARQQTEGPPPVPRAPEGLPASGPLTPSSVLKRIEALARDGREGDQLQDDELFSGPVSEHQLSLVDDLSRTLAQREAWLSHSERERALYAMLLLDLVQHDPRPPDQLTSRLIQQGIGAGDVHELGDGGSDTVARLLVRLLTWEPPGAEELIDVRTLHRIDDARTLLALLPSHRTSPLLSGLVDAFEHQLRWNLRHDEHFSPERFLALLEIREPHRSFFPALAVLCEGRTFRRTDGTVVDVLSMVQRHAEEATTIGTDDAFGRSLARLCERLQALLDETNDDLPAHLEQLFETIGEAADGQPGRPGTVLGVLHALHGEQRAVLQDGYPAWSDRTLNRWQRELAPDLLRIKTLAHALLPPDWRSGDEVREAVASLRSMLETHLIQLARSLPRFEAAQLRHVQMRCDAALHAWGEAVEHILGQWPESALRKDQLNFDACATVFAEIGRIEHDLLRGHLVRIFWQSLRHWATERATGTVDAWKLELDLLDQSLSRELHEANETTAASHWTDADRTRMTHSQVTLWCDLAVRATERNEEQRVLQLAEAERYAPLRTNAAAAETVRLVRQWCLDRYLLRSSAALRNDLRRQAGKPRRGMLIEYAAFFGNFSAVWLAMLIGAIFMLDFGDAWTDMADPDIADVRGITITFLIGLGGAFGYIVWNLRRKSGLSPGEASWPRRRTQLVRASAFAGLCLLYTLLVVTGMWWLLSRTDAVVEGVWAIGHIIVWAGFAMFAGVFLGLLAGGD
ncbi:MAG: hypothetical protein EA377_13600 [Phycisphaerales bacterium]|nr:MAG: hypothetical protein EA377_13600 [Phycisphaerales bacterium]